MRCGGIVYYTGADTKLVRVGRSVIPGRSVILHVTGMHATIERFKIVGVGTIRDQPHEG